MAGGPSGTLVQAMLDELPDAQGKLLLRCAVPRSFDRATVEAVLMPGADATDLAALEALGLVQAARGGDGRLRLAPAIRGTVLECLPPGEVARLRTDLAGYLRDDRPVEALHHLLAVDQDLALDLFAEAFEGALDRFDLAGGESLLAVFDGALPALDGPLRAARDDARLRLAQRLQWADDWYRSRRFLEREHSRERLERLLAGDGSQVLMLQAGGGLGKTMHLRWLTSRLCAPRGLACARIDFDAVVPTVALEEPWLVLLALADQLNRQLPGGPFTELLTHDLAGSLPRLWRAPQRGATTVRTLRAAATAAASTRSRFARAINALPDASPVVLIIDTLEVAVLRTGAPLNGLLGDLQQLVEECPALRVVFAGRFSLAERVPSLAPFLSAAIELPLEPFSLPERRRYLENRGFRDPELIETIAERSDGTPFKLALFAEIVEADGTIDAEDLKAYEQVDLMYLLERVLRRIDDRDVRWLLRYGAVPRMLDRRLVRKVMWPVMQREMPTAEGDVARAGLPAKAADTWTRRPGPRKLNELWDALAHHADRTSWVTVEGEEQYESMRLRPDVLQPMRRLVRDHNRDLHLELHRRAADDFRERALAEPDTWARATQEELYHRLHAEPVTGADVVLQRVDEAPSPEAMDALLKDLLSAEYVFAEPWLGEPDDGAEPGDTRVTLPPELVGELLWQTAFEQLEPLRRGDEKAWNVCREQLLRLERLRERTGVTLARSRIVPLQAMCDFYDPSHAGGSTSAAARGWVVPLREAADELGEGDERLQALLLLAELLADVDPDEATRILRDAEDEAIAVRGGALSKLAFGRRLAEHRFRSGDVEGATREIDRLRKTVRRQSNDDARLQVQQARIWLYGGQPERARKWALAAAEVAEGNLRATALLTAARASLEERDPEAALRTAASIGDWPRVTVRAPGLEGWLPAELASVRAEAHAVRERIGAVFDELDLADRSSVPTAGMSLRRLLGLRLIVELRIKRDLRQASTTLERASSALIGASDFTSLALRLHRVEWLQLRGEPEAAADELRQIAESLERDGAPPGHHVRVALEGLALGGEQAERHVGPLIRHLARIGPCAARLAMLTELRRVAPLPQQAGRQLSALIDEVPEGRAAALRLAEVARVCEGRQAAADLLEQIRGGGPVVDADWIRAAARVGFSGVLLERSLGLADRLEEREPGLAAACALAIAGAVLDGTDRSRRFQAERALSLAARCMEPEARQSGPGARLAELRERLHPGTVQGARELYERLGDVAGLERVSSPGGRDTGDVLIATAALPRRLRKLLDESRTEASYRLAERLDTSWRELGEELRAHLERLSGGRHSGPDLRVIIDDLAAQAMPWELALVGTEGWPRSLVRVRADVAAQRDDGPSPAVPVAIVVAPAATYEDLTLRGSQDWTGIVRRAYMACGMRTTDARPSAEYFQLPNVDAPAVVHVRAPIVVESGAPALDLAGDSTDRALHRKGAGSRAIHAPSFARALRASLEKARPLIVVLDPPAPRSGFEIANQICLRNVFAGALFDSGVADAVVGFGVPERVRQLGYGLLASALMSGEPLPLRFTQVRDLLHHAPDDDASALSAAALALFAADPGLRLSARE